LAPPGRFGALVPYVRIVVLRHQRFLDRQGPPLGEIQIVGFCGLSTNSHTWLVDGNFDRAATYLSPRCKALRKLHATRGITILSSISRSLALELICISDGG
jgi:hypothetical protein